MKEKILLVEDDPDFNTFLSEFLTSKGYSVTSVRLAEQAAGKLLLSNPHFDVLISDIQLPEFAAGIWLIMMAQKQYENLKIIPMSGGSKHIDDDQYFELIRLINPCGVLKKPFNPNELINAIDKKI